MFRHEHDPHPSLKDQGIIKIVGEGVEATSIRVSVEHTRGDKQPLIIEVKRDWYGDIREKFLSDAEKYFEPSVIVELDREIGLAIRDTISYILKEIEKQHAQDIELRRKQLVAEQNIATGRPPGINEGGHLETESSLTDLGDWRQPIPVAKAIFKKPNTILTVYGQIVTKNKVHSMVKGGQYQCSRCQTIQYVEFSKRSYPDDDDAPRIMNRMCRSCAIDRELEEGSAEYYRAMRLVRVGTEDVRCIDVELMDSDRYDDTDTLRVVLFEEHAEQVKIGEYAIIRGKLWLQRSPTGNRRMYYPVMHAHDIRYTSQTAYEPKPEDFARVRRFVELAKTEIDPRTKQPLGEDNVIDRLVFCHGRHRIVWNEPIKEGLLYAESSAGPDVVGGSSGNEIRKRIHLGIVGNKGLGKTRKAELVTKHNERNRMIDSSGATGKSITAIVSKEGESSAPILRIGPIAFAREAILILDELGELSLEEQGYLQSAMEAGFFTVNKHGMQAYVRADTVVIWTSNSTQGTTFSNDGTISLDQIPVRKQILDRTDLLLVDKPIPVEKRRQFNALRMELIKAYKNSLRGDSAKWKVICGFDHYVKIHLMVARRLALKDGPPTLTDEAADILEQADARIQEQKEKDNVPNVGSNRSLDTLIRIATEVAKLKLKREIEAVDAKRAVAFYNKTIKDIHTTITVPENAFDLACKAIEFTLQNEANGLAMKLDDLAKIASNRDPAIKWYLFQADKNKLGNVSTNKRLRRVRDWLANNSKIKQTNTEESEFLWVGPADTATASSKDTEEEASSNTIKGNFADSADSADRGSSGGEAREQPSSHDRQTKMSSHMDTPKRKKALAPKSARSAGSAESAKRHKIPLEEKEDKVLMACGAAMADYNKDKIEGKESGALFQTYGVWFYLDKHFPDEGWTAKKVQAVLEKLVQKGRVLTRRGDAPDRWYLMGGRE